MDIISLDKLEELCGRKMAEKMKQKVYSNNFIFNEMSNSKNLDTKATGDLLRKYEKIIRQFNIHISNERVNGKGDECGVSHRTTRIALMEEISKIDGYIPFVKYKFLIRMNDILKLLNERYKELKGKSIMKQNLFIKKKVKCECGKEVSYVNFSKHKKTEKHIEIMINKEYEKKDSDEEDDKNNTNCQEEEEREAEE